MSRYIAEKIEKRSPGNRPSGWVCVCAGMKNYRRHTEPWQCRKEFTTGQRVLAWLKEEFGR